MSQVERDEQDMLQYGGGRSLLGLNLKVYVLFPNASVAVVQNGGQDDDLSHSTTVINGGQDDDLDAADTVDEGGEDTV